VVKRVVVKNAVGTGAQSCDMQWEGLSQYDYSFSCTAVLQDTLQIQSW
jgi:hypothetical protein